MAQVLSPIISTPKPWKILHVENFTKIHGKLHDTLGREKWRKTSPRTSVGWLFSQSGKKEKHLNLSGPTSHDIAILSLRYLISRYLTPPKWCGIPLGTWLHTGTSVRHPILHAYRAIMVRYPTKQAQKSVAILLSLQASRPKKKVSLLAR